MIIVIDRGHGGTRLISRLLLENGIATGNVNYARETFDFLEPAIAELGYPDGP